MSQKTDLLRHVPLFAGCGTRQLEEIGQLADEVDVAAGTTLMTEGQHADEFFVIVEGSVRVSRGGTVVRTMGPGEFLGEIALVDGGPRTATAVVETPSRLLVVGHREFHSLMEAHPQISMSILEALARRVRNLDPSTADGS
jgi:CRP/FNR family transcriptional regulator, cyclic AMP receptor protein